MKRAKDESSRMGTNRGKIYKGGLALALMLLVVGGTWVWHWVACYFTSRGKSVSVPLTRGEFIVSDFVPKKNRPDALILFASGDGGWGKLEERISRALSKKGYEVVGINSVRYAKTDYDLTRLESDYGIIAQQVEKRYGKQPLPLS